MKYRMIQRVGDRGGGFSIRDYAFTIAANPMSDRVQMVIEIYDDGQNDMREQQGGREAAEP